MSTKLSTIYQHWHPQRASTASTGIAVTGYQASIKMTRHTRTPYYSNSQLGRVTINQRYTDARKRKRVYSVCTPRTGHVRRTPQSGLRPRCLASSTINRNRNFSTDFPTRCIYPTRLRGRISGPLIIHLHHCVLANALCRNPDPYCFS